MTNVTLSVEDEVYLAMREYSEIKWSEFIRKAIKKRIEELRGIEKDKNHEGILTMFSSEDVLSKDWKNKADSRWDDV